MKHTYTLTAADIELIDLVQSMAQSMFLDPTAGVTAKQNMMAVWNVLGEKHGFKPETAKAHPDGEPEILAEPVPRYEVRALDTSQPMYFIFDTKNQCGAGAAALERDLKYLELECESLNKDDQLTANR